MNLKHIERKAKTIEAFGDKRAFYSAFCTWWTTDMEHFHSDASNVPSCPHCGSPLFQMPLKKFLATARDNPDIYGEKGLEALAAAHHINGYHSTTKGWDSINRQLDGDEHLREWEKLEAHIRRDDVNELLSQTQPLEIIQRAREEGVPLPRLSIQVPVTTVAGQVYTEHISEGEHGSHVTREIAKFVVNHQGQEAVDVPLVDAEFLIGALTERMPRHEAEDLFAKWQDDLGDPPPPPPDGQVLALRIQLSGDIVEVLEDLGYDLESLGEGN